MTRGAARRRVAIGLMVLLLAGCDKIGEGSGPVGLHLADANNLAGPYRAVECDLLDLYAVGEWRGDDTYDADVSSRANWSSDDPGVAEVGDGVTRSRGSILARSAGTTTVRAEYVGFTAAVSVTVLPIVDTRIRPDRTALAAGSTQAFTLEVLTDDDDGWLAHDAQWTILQPGAAATVNAGLVTALGGPQDVPFTLEASVSGCSVTAQRELRVSPVSHLALEYEQPTTQALPLGVTAMIGVVAHFIDPAIEPQNLSAQVDVDLEDTEEGAATFVSYADGVALRGLVEGKQARLEFRYPPLDLTLQSEPYVFADVEQETLRVDPTQLTLQYPDEAQLQAFGQFSDGIERVITRHVTWTVSDDAVASITSQEGGAGLLTITQDVDQSIQVEVFGVVDGEAVTAESEIRIERAAQ